MKNGPPVENPEFSSLARRARLRLLEMHYRAKVGHIGGNLSCLDALLYLHHYVMRPEDVFLLSKGHAAGALYVCLWSTGRLSDRDLDTFHDGEGTYLAGHPVPAWSEHIPFATGSLGHGLCASAGIALGMRLQQLPGRVFCLCSDGEWQEGSTWEGLIFSLHQRLDKLHVLVDVNGLQGFGTTEEVASMSGLAERIAGFGADVESLDGHDPAALGRLGRARSAGPSFALLKTVKGKGVPFMEGRMEWHYLPLDEALYRRARQALEA